MVQTGLAALALALTVMSSAALGQSLVGKTVSGSFTFSAKLCKQSDGQCMSAQEKITANVYFGSDGGVYDITSDASGNLLSSGNRHKLGEWLQKGELRSRWTLARGGAVNDVVFSGMTVRSVFRVKGNQCTIDGALTTTLPGIVDQSRISVDYCTVRAGNPLAR